jgi:excinuclease ABC subunit C
LEEIYFPEDSLPLHINKKSESLKLIQRMRDEAHRFGITHHRNRRSKAFTNTELESVTGIGKKTADALLRHFKSMKKLREASTEEIIAIVGNAKAKVIREYFDPSTSSG